MCVRQQQASLNPYETLTVADDRLSAVSLCTLQPFCVGRGHCRLLMILFLLSVVSHWWNDVYGRHKHPILPNQRCEVNCGLLKRERERDFQLWVLGIIPVRETLCVCCCVCSAEIIWAGSALWVLRNVACLHFDREDEWMRGWENERMKRMQGAVLARVRLITVSWWTCAQRRPWSSNSTWQLRLLCEAPSGSFTAQIPVLHQV